MKKTIFTPIAYLLVGSAILLDRYISLSDIIIEFMYALAISFFILSMIPKRIFENIRNLKVKIFKKLHI